MKGQWVFVSFGSTSRPTASTGQSSRSGVDLAHLPNPSHRDGYRQEAAEPRAAAAHRLAGAAGSPESAPGSGRWRCGPPRRATLRPAHTWVPEPKARWRLGSRRDVEPVRIGKLGRIAVGGADADGDERARRHGDAADLDRRASSAGCRAGWSSRSAGTPRRAVRISSGLGDQPRLLVGPFEQREQPIADQVGGGLVAGVEDEDDVVQQLALGQPLAVLPRPGSAGSARRARGRPDARAGRRPARADRSTNSATARSPRSRCSARRAPARARPGSRATSRAAARAPRAARRAGCRSPRPGRRRRDRR